MTPHPSSHPLPLPPAFNRLAWSNLAAQSAEQLSLTAVPMLAVLALGAGAGAVGLLSSLQSLPFLLLSIPLGLVADRISRKRLMVAAEVLRAFTLLCLFAAAASSSISLMLLALLGFMGATGTVAFSVTAPALVPALVPRDALARANGRLELARSAAFAAGPALAGALVAWAGASWAFALATGLSCAAVLMLLRLPESTALAGQALATRRHPWLELRDGAALVWQHAYLRPMLLTTVVWNLSWFVLQAAYVPYAVRALGMSAFAVGLTLACYGAGMVLGSLLAPRVMAALPFGRAIQLGPMVSVFAATAMVVTLVWPSPAWAGVSFFLFGAGPIIWTITSVTLRQTATPSAMLGRVSALFLTAGFGARPLGAALGGLVGSHFGEGACLWLAWAGFCVQAMMIMASKLSRLRSLAEVG